MNLAYAILYLAIKIWDLLVKREGHFNFQPWLDFLSPEFYTYGDLGIGSGWLGDSVVFSIILEVWGAARFTNIYKCQVTCSMQHSRLGKGVWCQHLSTIYIRLTAIPSLEQQASCMEECAKSFAFLHVRPRVILPVCHRGACILAYSGERKQLEKCVLTSVEIMGFGGSEI